MRNKFFKFTFQKIHVKTNRMQFEFLKSDKRAKSYERLKFEKNRPKPRRHSEFRLPTGIPVVKSSGIPVLNRFTGCRLFGPRKSC